MSRILLSKEFGVNPSIQVCSCCGNDLGLILFGTKYKDESGKTAQAPDKIVTGEICDDCGKVIDNGGVFFIEVRDGEVEKSPDNPYRTGRLVALRGEKAREIFPDCSPINYLEESVFDNLFGEYINKNN